MKLSGASPEDLRDFLIAEREAAGLNRTDLAADSDVTYQLVNHLEHGFSWNPILRVLRVLRTLGWDVVLRKRKSSG